MLFKEQKKRRPHSYEQEVETLRRITALTAGVRPAPAADTKNQPKMARFGMVIMLGLAALSVCSFTVASDVGWPGTPNTWSGCAANCIRCQYTAQNGVATGSQSPARPVFYFWWHLPFRSVITMVITVLCSIA